MSTSNRTTHAANTRLLREAGQSIRHITQANEEYNEEDVRTIWHRGRYRTELLSWQHRDGTILRQELTFFGMVTDYRLGQPLKTGRVPPNEDTAGGARPQAHLLAMDDSHLRRCA